MTEQEEIQKCLNCPKEECDNCLGRKSNDMRKTWGDKDVQFLIENQNMRIKEQSMILHRSEKSIVSKRKQLGLRKYARKR